VADRLVSVERGTGEFRGRVDDEPYNVGAEPITVDESVAKKLVELAEESDVVLKVQSPRAAKKEEAG
jgi:hypothetical protein